MMNKMLVGEPLRTKYGTAKVDSSGYYKIKSTKEGNYNKPLHRLIFEDYYQIKLPKNIHVHHNDGNKLNNEIWNLIPLTIEEHASLHHKGKILSEETRKKMSISKMGENNPNYGKCLSRKHKQNLSRAHKDKKLSDSHKEKIRLANSKSKNTTGFLNVSIKKRNKYCKQGFLWRFRKANEYDISSIDLMKLKNKVLENGVEWIVIDEYKAKETCEKYGYDFKRLI